MTATFEAHLDNVKMNHQAKSASERSSTKETHPTDCSTWTTKVVNNNVN